MSECPVLFSPGVSMRWEKKSLRSKISLSLSLLWSTKYQSYIIKSTPCLYDILLLEYGCGPERSFFNMVARTLFMVGCLWNITWHSKESKDPIYVFTMFWSTDIPLMFFFFFVPVLSLCGWLLWFHQSLVIVYDIVSPIFFPKYCTLDCLNKIITQWCGMSKVPKFCPEEEYEIITVMLCYSKR